MTDLFRLVGPLRPASASPSEASVRATPDRQHPERGATAHRDDAVSLRAALDRLDQLLKSGKPAHSDVAKGFYLNVLV